jgi:hypothetical protein
LDDYYSGAGTDENWCPDKSWQRGTFKTMMYTIEPVEPPTENISVLTDPPGLVSSINGVCFTDEIQLQFNFDRIANAKVRLGSGLNFRLVNSSHSLSVLEGRGLKRILLRKDQKHFSSEERFY